MATKLAYDDVFSGYKKKVPFTTTALSPRTEDYAEIFGGGGGCLRGTSTSIPVLDLPPADVAEVPASFREGCGRFDYSEVFGGGTEAIKSLAVFEEVFRERFNNSNSDEAWTPAQSETLSDESEPFACTDSYQSISNADFHHSSNNMKHFKVSYNKVFHTSESDLTNGVAHVVQLNDVPGYSFLVDEPSPLQKMVVINNLKHEGVGMEEGKPLRKTTGCDNKPFVTISDISLKTRPSHLPPPSRPPPVVGPKDRDNSTQSSKIKVSRTFSFGETTSDDNSPLFYDVEVDASTSAAVSAATMQDVMEKAQKKLKSAKHKKDRSKIASGRDLGAVDGLANDSTKHGTGYGLLQEPSLKNEENVEWKQDDEFYEVTETIDCRNLIIVRDKRRVAVHDFRACQVILQQDEFNSKMKRDDDILEKIMVEAVEGENLVKLIKVQKNEAEDERKCSNDLGLEENGVRLGENVEREAKERAKNEKRLKESSEWEEKEKKDREAWEREEKEKSEKEAHDRELGEKIIRQAIEKEENEKRLRLALEEKERKSRVAWEREEKEKSEKDDREREFEQNRIREAIEKEKKEKRLRLALAEKEKKQREAWEREEREKKERQAREREFEEKRLQAAIEKEENEKRLRLALEENERKIREAREREEKEEREKEAREREDKEKREKEAREREDKEKREKEARERKENEKREKEAREREEKEEREKEAREREEKEEREKEAREREEKEEREKEARERKEKEGREKEALEREIEENSLKKAYEENEKKQKEAYERKIKEKTDKKAHERELEEKLQREAIEQEENEIRLKIAVKKEESEKKEELSSETEGEKRLEDDQMWPNIEDVPNNTFQNEENTEKVKAGCGRKEYTQEVHEREVNGKRSDEVFEQDAIDKMWEEEYGLHKNVAFCGDASKVDKDSGEVKRTNGPFIVEDSAKAAVQVGDLSSFGVARGNLQHENSEIKVGEIKVSLPMHDITFEFEKKPFNKTGSLAEPNVVDSDLGEGGAIPKKVQVGKEKKQVKVEVQRQNAERKVKSLDDAHIREERMKREREQENERLRKIEEEREREKEREKDRMAVNMACSERENTDARLTEAQERLAKINAEAKLRAERAAVERATAEARERAFQKAKAGKATVENRERIDRTQSSVRSDSCQGVRSTNGSINAYSSGNGGVEVESAERCRARLERYQRTAQRAAKALEEKNMRDLIVQRELAERNRLAEGLDAEVKRWSSGKEGNLRALLSTLQYILGPDSGWKPIHLTEIITSLAVRSAYRKATLCVHPDKLQQRGASIHQKYVCEKVFDLLKAAWNKFNSEER